MTKEEKKNEESKIETTQITKEEIKDTKEEIKEERRLTKRESDLENWKPKTSTGKKVKDGQIKEIDEILNKGEKILEKEIVDILLPNLESDLLHIGQSKGKFGGGKRSIWKQTQKKSKEGNVPKFSAIAIVGNRDGYIGIGKGKGKETVPAREKANRNAKIQIISIARGCGSWDCGCKEPHSIPFKVEGKVGSVKVKLMPAPKGTGLSAEGEVRRILNLAGVKDIHAKVTGKTTTRSNLINACFNSLKQLTKTKVRPEFIEKSGMIIGVYQ